MTSIINATAERIDYFVDSRRPLDTDGARPQSGVVQASARKVEGLVVSPPATPADLPALLNALRHSDSIDDRELLLEKVLTAMSRLQKFDISMTLQKQVIKLLYDDLPHPPSGYIAELAPDAAVVRPPRQGYVKYAYRAADGSNYNPLKPGIGKAGSPYARSVPSTNATPRSALPDAGLVFDTLLKRDKFVEHPGGISALFFAFADLVIHSIFNTNHTDWTVNDASSYLDLGVLYGNNDRQVQAVRRKDGSGKLLDDVFADGRLLLMPPATCALLILLNRNHNFIAQKILDINENGNLRQPYPEDAASKQAQDEEIFQRARLVNCGFFIHIILGDYVGAILGLVRDGSAWRLDPLMTIRDTESHQFVPTGEGNVVSIEFNLLYRWHAALSQPDTTWTTNTFNQLFEGADPKDITIQKFKEAAHKHLIPPANVQEWTFGGLKRNADKRFEDADLANMLHNATEARAGAFKARGIPEALRIIEVMGIEQSRSWGTCSLNEFRKFLGLKPYSTFEEWNPNPEIHRAAASLYRDIDNLELHVGLQAEETKLPGEGAGLCPGYTISRAILSDAVALARGDRFMTVDFTPFNLTSWGYQDCQYDPEDGSYGGLLTKLLFRTLPDYYPRGSAYAHFPFLVPSYMKQNLEKTNPTVVSKYSWTRPRPPAPLVVVDTFDGVKQVLEDTDSFMSAYNERLFTVARPILAPNTAVKSTLEEEEKAQAVLDASRNCFTAGVLNVSRNVFSKPDSSFAQYFAERAVGLIHEKSYSVGNGVTYIDIIRDVINLLPIHWISEEIAGLPLKTESNPRGVWRERVTCEKFEQIARYVYLNFDPVDDWKLREESQHNFQQLVAIVEAHIDRIHYLVSLKDHENHMGVKNYKSHDFLRKLGSSLIAQGDTNIKPREFAAQVIAAIVPTAAHYSQAVAQVVDFYLGDDKKGAREDIVNLVNSAEEGAYGKVMRYVYEALRVTPPVAGAYRTVTRDTSVGSIELKAGDHVFASILSADRNVPDFKPVTSKADSRSSFEHHTISSGFNGLMSPEFFEATVPHVLSAIFSLRNLQRGPGQSGSFTRFVEDWHSTQQTEYISQKGTVTPFPDSLVAQFTR